MWSRLHSPSATKSTPEPDDDGRSIGIIMRDARWELGLS
jgi:hypothetical protein